MASVTEGLKRKDMFAANAGTLIIIGLDTDDGPDHPLYDARIKLPLNEAMVKNIMALGVLEPVIAKKDGDRAIIVDGRRREIHAREASKRSIAQGGLPIMVPFIITRGSENQIIGAMVSANELRHNDEYQQKAERCRRMIQINGMDEDDCALYFGVHVQTIKQWMSWFDLAPEAQEAVAAGAMTPTSATKLAKLPQEKQREHVARIKDEVQKNGGKKVSGKQVEAKAKQTKADSDPQEVILKPSTRLVRKVAEILIDDPAKRALLAWVLDGTLTPEIKALVQKAQSQD